MKKQGFLKSLQKYFWRQIELLIVTLCFSQFFWNSYEALTDQYAQGSTVRVAVSRQKPNSRPSWLGTALQLRLQNWFITFLLSTSHHFSPRLFIKQAHFERIPHYLYLNKCQSDIFKPVAVTIDSPIILTPPIMLF